jgi:hypothetical protein
MQAGLNQGRKVMGHVADVSISEVESNGKIGLSALLYEY